MQPTTIEVNAVTFPDPQPPLGIISSERQVLVARVAVASVYTNMQPVMILVPGEALGNLIAMLQTLVGKYPELTTERLAAEGVAVTSEEGKTLNLVAGPEREQ